MTTFDLNAYRNWAQKWQAELRPMFSPTDVPTVKTLLFLALLEAANSDCDYNQLLAQIESSGVVPQHALKRDSLRVGIRDLRKTLDDNPTTFHLVSRGRGMFRLTRRASPHVKMPPAYSQVVTHLPLDHPLGQPEELLRNLFETRVLPFHSLYYLPKSAAWWANYSQDEVAIRRPLEAASWRCFGIRDRMSSQSGRVLSVVGLAVGEGHGEIALLHEILRDIPSNVQVHYLAIDLSPSLLLHHAQNLSLEFRHLMASGRMVCATVVGNIFDVSPAATPTAWDPIRRAREKVFPEFLPWTSPMIATYLGNCMGNEPADSERRFFELLRTRVGDRLRESHQESAGPLHCIIGVSVDREEEEYTIDWAGFLLEGPRRLLDHGLIQSHNDPEGDSFTVEGDHSEATIVNYSASLGLRGRRYVFDHQLRHPISASPPTALATLAPDALDKNKTIQLYAITKYDMPTMMSFVDDLGYEVVEVVKEAKRDPIFAQRARHPVLNNNRWLEQVVHTKKGKRHYGVFCVRPIDHGNGR